jgi:beta-lactamase regulating signal transducer with metallopeptidase domain
MTFMLPELARWSAERMLNAMAEGLVLALLAWVLLRVMGRRNASTRFAVWFAALIAIAALPWLGSITPARSSGAAVSHFALTIPGSWAIDILTVWAVLAGFGLVRVGIGLWHLRRVRASSVDVNLATLDPISQRTLQEFQATRPVTLAVSGELRVPTAIGFFKPMVVLPAWALRELSAEELNSILIHELAHLRRRDDWTNLAQKVLQALLFFHPAVWWVERQLSLEREMACDDVVLSHTQNPRAYAECLVSVAEKSFVRRGLALAQAAVSRMRQTTLRVSQILDRDRPGAVRIWKPAVGMVAMTLLASVVGLERVPQLVTFSDGTAPVAMASVTAPVVSPAVSSAPAKPVAAKKAKPVAPKSILARSTPQVALEWQPFPVNFVGSQMGVQFTQARMTDAQTVMVVTQTQQWDPQGQYMVSTWRVTVLKVNQVPRILTAPAKAI